MKRPNMHSLAVLFLTVMMVAALAACAGRPEPANSEPSSSQQEEAAGKRLFINTLPIPNGATIGLQVPKFTEKIKEKHAINSDTVGWLQLPNTTLSDVVVWYPGDRNEYYYRRNFEKKTSFNGSYYADYRCKFGAGASALSHNTVIYGHSMKDDPDSGLFSSLKHYLDVDFARENPYIFFSTGGEDLTWEVFSVFYATVELPYNRPDLDAAQFSEVISESTKRSLYTYDTQISSDDKILTLSTCTYSVPNIGKLGYPNEYRFAIMAKLVDAPSKPMATLEVNPSPKEP